MKITYIHHSSFLAELETVAMLFDYTEGTIPELPKEKPIFVFASHRHGDHYSERIFKLKESHGNTRFILSDDIGRKRLVQEVLESVISMKPGELWEDGTMQVQTFCSTDEGVAFLIKAEGKTIYHGGDLNNWRWEGEPEDWNKSMAEKYTREVDKLAGLSIDAAFLPLDPRQEENFYLGFDEFMRKTRTKHAFPMHCWGDFSVIGRLQSMEVSGPYRARIVEIQKDGDVFELKDEEADRGGRDGGKTDDMD